MNEALLQMVYEHNEKVGSMLWAREDKVKFAELVARECAKVAAQTPCSYEDEFAKQTYGHTWDMACVESAKNIRKHFGVE